MTTRTRTRLFEVAIGAAALVAAAGCDSYNPDLGNAPFRCGTSEPRCPSGYECVQASESEQVCVKKGSNREQPDAGSDEEPDARPFTCNDDSEIEPNESLANPFPTPIPEFQDEVSYVGLAICPDDDIDVFRFGIDQSGKNLRVDLSYQSNQGELLLDVLNSNGSSIRMGTPASGDPDLLRAEIPNMPQGTYYVQVRAPAGIQNNYGIDIVTTGN